MAGPALRATGTVHEQMKHVKARARANFQTPAHIAYVCDVIMHVNDSRSRLDVCSVAIAWPTFWNFSDSSVVSARQLTL